MAITDYIDPFVFLISLAVGIFYTYLTAPKPKIVIKYPTPFNSKKLTYVDDAGVCYKYRTETVQCPADKNTVRKVPVQQINP